MKKRVSSPPYSNQLYCPSYACTLQRHTFLHSFVWLFTQSFICLFFIAQSFVLSQIVIHSLIHPSTHPSIHPSICPPIRPSMHAPIHPSIHTYTHPFITHSLVHSTPDSRGRHVLKESMHDWMNGCGCGCMNGWNQIHSITAECFSTDLHSARCSGQLGKRFAKVWSEVAFPCGCS